MHGSHRANKMKRYFKVVIEKDEDGVFIATVPQLPGCVTDGKTRKEALKNVKEAVQGYLESLKKHKEPVPPPITEETIAVNVSA
jgi:predicted RNase H-like HicB family nuclease